MEARYRALQMLDRRFQAYGCRLNSTSRPSDPPA